MQNFLTLNLVGRKVTTVLERVIYFLNIQVFCCDTVSNGY